MDGKTAELVVRWSGDGGKDSQRIEKKWKKLEEEDKVHPRLKSHFIRKHNSRVGQFQEG